MTAPFPWQELPSVSRGEQRAVAALRARFPGVTIARVAGELRALTGHDVAIELRRRTLRASADAGLGDQGACTLLALGDVPCAIEVEPELALAMVTALSGGKTLPKIAKSRRVAPEIAGALAGVLLHVLRNAGCDVAALVRADVDVEETLGFFGHSPSVLAIDATVRIGMLKTRARVVLTAMQNAPSVPALRGSELLHRLGKTPLSLPVVVGATWAKARELGNYADGDVVVLENVHRNARCAIAAPAADRGISVELLDVVDGHQRLRLRAETLPLAAAADAPHEPSNMSQVDNPTAATMELAALDEKASLADALGDVPLLVRAEMGSVTLPAHQWATLAVGDVLTLDGRVGDAVVLRIGGRVVARGELVDVEGSLGVRILEKRT